MMLLSVDPLSLDRFDASAAAIGCEFAERLIQALQLQFLAVAQHRRRENRELSEPGAELTAAAGVHSVTAANRADLACSTMSRLPRTLALLKAGKLTRRHVEMVEHATRELTDQQAALVDRKVRGRLGLQRRLAEAVERVAPGTAEKKNDRAVADRDVQFWTDQADGKAGIELVGPVDRIAIIKAALDSCARSKLPDDLRSLGQRRFDVLSDWARTTLGLPTTPGERPPAGSCDSCGRAGSPSVAVSVTISLGALLQLSDTLGDLNGHPIPAAVARELAADGRWRRLVLEDHTGRGHERMDEPGRGKDTGDGDGQSGCDDPGGEGEPPGLLPEQGEIQLITGQQEEEPQTDVRDQLQTGRISPSREPAARPGSRR